MLWWPILDRQRLPGRVVDRSGSMVGLTKRAQAARAVSFLRTLLFRAYDSGGKKVGPYNVGGPPTPLGRFLVAGATRAMAQLYDRSARRPLVPCVLYWVLSSTCLY